jgi:hypothetical protein
MEQNRKATLPGGRRAPLAPSRRVARKVTDRTRIRASGVIPVTFRAARKVTDREANGTCPNRQDVSGNRQLPPTSSTSVPPPISGWTGTGFRR